MPITPDDAARHGKAVADIYADAAHHLLRVVSRRLARGIDSPGWAERKAVEILALRKAAQQAVDEVAGATDAQARKALRLAYGDGWEQAERDLRDLLRDRLQAERRPLHLDVTGTNLDRVDALARELTGQLASTLPNAVRWAEDIYRQVIAHTVSVAVAGAETRREAAARALARFAAVGVDGFTDVAGRSWRLETYAEMATRTALIRTSVNGATDRLQRQGRDLVRVSDHAEECPLCRPFEGKVLSLTGADGYPSLASAVARGLFHPNCRHSVGAYVHGLSKRVTGDADPAGYRERQRQRQLERRVRHAKRQLAAVDGLGTAAQVRKARARLAAVQGELREFVAAHDRKRQPQREQIGRAI